MRNGWSALAVGVALVALLAAAEAKPDQKTDCDGNALALNDPKGSLNINGSIEVLENKTCEWIINSTAVDPNKRLIHLDVVDDLALGENDTLTVVTEDDKKTTLFSSKGYIPAGVILLGTSYKQVRVKVYFASEPPKNMRKNFLQYGTSDNSIQIQNIDATNSFEFPNLNTADAVFADLKSLEFTITLAAKSKTDNLLLTLEQLQLNGGKVTFDKVDKYQANQTFDDSNKPEFLLTSDQQINIKITNYKPDKTKGKGIKVHYELVDSFCSQYKVVTDLDLSGETNNFKQPQASDLVSISSYRCLNIFEHQNTAAKFLLDLRNFTFTNAGDLITVLDGDSRDSKTLAVIETHYLENYWKQTYLYTTSNKIWIMYDSPQVLNRSPPANNDFGVQALSQGGSITLTGNTTNTTLTLNESKAPKPPLPIVFVVTGDADKQIVLDFDEKTALPGTGPLISVSESSSKGGQPFITMNSGEYTPDILASNGNQMKVEFHQNVKYSVQVMMREKGCHSTVVGNTGTAFSLSGCSDVCSWLIPKRDNSDGTFVVQISHLNLTQDDELKMECLPSKTSVLNLKGPLQTSNFPNLVIDANMTYVLYILRKCPKETVKSQVIAASMVYQDNDQSTQVLQIGSSETGVLQTASYPNFYSLGMDNTFEVSAKTNATNNSKAILSFTDIDLIPGHQLLLRSKNANTVINGTDMSSLSDIMVELPVMLNLTSRALASSKPPFSARGFSANVTGLNCGHNLSVEAGKPIFVATDNPLKGIKKCVWIVTTTNPNASAVNILNFTVNAGDLSRLTIHDSNSLRYHNLVNFSYFHNVSYMLSSTNTVIIEYEIKDETKDSLNITVQQGVCNWMCGHNIMRCTIPQFHCNGFNDCGDWSDENCSGPEPKPTPAPQPPPPAPEVIRTGVNGWVVFLVICPLCIGIGVLGTMFGPQMLRRFGRGRYREFQDFSEVS